MLQTTCRHQRSWFGVPNYILIEHLYLVAPRPEIQILLLIIVGTPATDGAKMSSLYDFLNFYMFEKNILNILLQLVYCHGFYSGFDKHVQKRPCRLVKRKGLQQVYTLQNWVSRLGSLDQHCIRMISSLLQQKVHFLSIYQSMEF